MASNFIPMHSSSPPPLDDCPDNDDDEEEEFGTFSSATIAFDSSFDSPDKCKPFKAGDNGVNDVTFKNDLNSFYADLPHTEQKYSRCEKKLEAEKASQNESGSDNRNLSEKHPLPGNHMPSKDSTKSSRICVPDDVSVESLELTDVTEKYQDSYNDSKANVANCELDDRHFVPPVDDDDSDEFNLDCDQDQKRIPNNVCKSNNQSIDLFPCESQKPLSSVNNLKDDIEHSKTLANDALHVSKNSEEINNWISDPSFPTDFSNIDEYDDFKSCVIDDIKEEKFDADFGSVDAQLDADFGSVDAQFDADFDADFADFQSCPSQPPADVCNADEGNEFLDGDDEDFDDFSDFRSCEKTNCVSDSKDGGISMLASAMTDDFRSEKNVNNEADDFDDFQGPPVDQGFAQFESDSKAESDSPEFADFEGASFSSTSSDNFQHFSPLQSSLLNQEKNTDKLATVMNAIFPHQPEESVAPDISQEPSSEILEQSNKSRRLWEKLHEAEQTPGMRFHWGVSHSFQQLLRSVNVDYHSILRTSSVPIFASSLSLLEPVKGLANSVNQESEDRIQSPKDPIPPVEFDWNSSGLINPLDSGQTSSVLMDLSFLTSSESSSTTVVAEDSFENEMLKPSPALPCLETNSKTFILEELLSKNVCTLPTSHFPHRPSDLSDEAISVLDQLPDLSFMRAKVLMFPLSNKT